MRLTKVCYNKDLICGVCNEGQANFLTYINLKEAEFFLPICESCSKLDETELLKRINKGGN